MAAKLTARQIKAVGLFAEGLTHLAIAAQLGVSLRTIERWSTRADIRQAVADAQAKAVEALGQEIFEKCRAAVNRGLPKSIKRVVEALDNSDARIQIRAAEAIAKWSGFYQPTAQNKPEPQGNAEGNLKGYLAYLEANGHGNLDK